MTHSPGAGIHGYARRFLRSNRPPVAVAQVASCPGDASRSPAAVDGLLSFRGWSAAEGRELWKSDGGARGTLLAADILPGPGSSAPKGLTEADGVLYFAADDGVAGRELWRIDATSTSASRVADIRPGANGSDPTDLTAVSERLFFAADDGSSGRELWAYDFPPHKTGFYSLRPCRLYDSRDATFFNAPAGGSGPLLASEARPVKPMGTCGVSGNASVVAINVTAVTPAAAGSLMLFPSTRVPASATPDSDTNVVSLVPGRTRAGAALRGLSPAGYLDAKIEPGEALNSSSTWRATSSRRGDRSRRRRRDLRRPPWGA